MDESLENYAFLNEDNFVIAVLVFNNPDNDLLEQIKNELSASSFKSCSEYGDTSVGSDFFNDKFYPPKPYPSWIRNENLGIWEAPIPMPDPNESTDHYYIWDEEELNWVAIPITN